MKLAKSVNYEMGRVQKKKGKKKKAAQEKKSPKLNQFGERMAMAKAVRRVITAWECTECGALSFGIGGKPPFRCSNRKGCGKPFHGVIENDLASG